MPVKKVDSVLDCVNTGTADAAGQSTAVTLHANASDAREGYEGMPNGPRATDDDDADTCKGLSPTYGMPNGNVALVTLFQMPALANASAGRDTFRLPTTAGVTKHANTVPDVMMPSGNWADVGVVARAGENTSVAHRLLTVAALEGRDKYTNSTNGSLRCVDKPSPSANDTSASKIGRLLGDSAVEFTLPAKSTRLATISNGPGGDTAGTAKLNVTVDGADCENVAFTTSGASLLLEFM